MFSHNSPEGYQDAFREAAENKKFDSAAAQIITLIAKTNEAGSFFMGQVSPVALFNIATAFVPNPTANEQAALKIARKSLGIPEPVAS